MVLGSVKVGLQITDFVLSVLSPAGDSVTAVVEIVDFQPSAVVGESVPLLVLVARKILRVAEQEWLL
jgi:hypothetical protein